MRLRLLQRIEPSPITRFGSCRVPEYLFIVVPRGEWLSNASSYVPRGHDRVRMVDEDRIDAFVSREFFRAEYERGIERLTSRSACAWRDISSWFGFKDDIVDNVRSDRRADVNSNDEEMMEHTQYALVVLSVDDAVSESLLWDAQNHNMPTLMRALRKNDDIYKEYPLRYDTRRLRVALPTYEKLHNDLLHIRDQRARVLLDQ